MKGVWSLGSGGLCRQCAVETAVEDRLRAERSRADLASRILEGARSDLTAVLREMVADEPVCCTFLRRRLVERRSGGLAVAPLGGGVSGLLDAAVHGALVPGPSRIEGELAVLIVTRQQLVLGQLPSDFDDLAGAFGPPQLAAFRSALQHGQGVRRAFDIRRTRLWVEGDETLGLESGEERLLFESARLLVNGADLGLPRAAEVESRVTELGPLPTAAQFVSWLVRDQCALRDAQFEEVRGDERYLGELVEGIARHPGRDLLFPKLDCLGPELRRELTERIRQRGSAFPAIRARTLGAGALALGGLAAAAAGLPGLAVALAGAVLAAGCARGWGLASWCREVSELSRRRRLLEE